MLLPPGSPPILLAPLIGAFLCVNRRLCGQTVLEPSPCQLGRVALEALVLEWIAVFALVASGLFCTLAVALIYIADNVPRSPEAQKRRARPVAKPF